jgi:hypothetical protein
MKTTIDIDENLLTSVMTLTGVKTRRGAVNYALREAEKSAKVERLVRESPPDEAFKAAVAEGYDIAALRDQEIPER